MASCFIFSKLKVQSDDSGANPTSEGDIYRASGFELEVNRKLYMNILIGIGWRRISLDEFEDGPSGIKIGLPNGATSKGQIDSIFLKMSYFLELSQIL